MLFRSGVTGSNPSGSTMIHLFSIYRAGPGPTRRRLGSPVRAHPCQSVSRWRGTRMSAGVGSVHPRCKKFCLCFIKNAIFRNWQNKPKNCKCNNLTILNQFWANKICIPFKIFCTFQICNLFTVLPNKNWCNNSIL